MTEKQIFDIGDYVECDGCGKVYTQSAEKGGLLFCSKGYGPCCAPRMERLAEQYGEQRFILARANPEETFYDFVLRIRGGNNQLTFQSFDNFEDMAEALGLKE